MNNLKIPLPRTWPACVRSVPFSAELSAGSVRRRSILSAITTPNAPPAGFKAWCSKRGIKLRFAAIGKYGSIAVIERFILSFKNECTRRILVPLGSRKMREEACWHVTWHNKHRPHTFLGGRTPEEVYRGLEPANRKPRLEPRTWWPMKSGCASPQASVEGEPGARFELLLSFLGGRKHLPIVGLKKVA